MNKRKESHRSRDNNTTPCAKFWPNDQPNASTFLPDNIALPLNLIKLIPTRSLSSLPRSLVFIFARIYFSIVLSFSPSPSSFSCSQYMYVSKPLPFPPPSSVSLLPFVSPLDPLFISPFCPFPFFPLLIAFSNTYVSIVTYSYGVEGGGRMKQVDGTRILVQLITFQGEREGRNNNTFVIDARTRLSPPPPISTITE